MKRLLLLAALFAITFSNAQQQTINNKPDRPGLTEFEFTIAREQYRKVKESPDSKMLYKMIGEQRDMLNGVEIPLEMYAGAGDNPEKLKQAYTAFLTKNIQKTKYKSVQEGLAAMESIVWLSQKQVDDNKGLYAMIGKSSKEQYLKIVNTNYMIRKNRFWYPRFY